MTPPARVPWTLVLLLVFGHCYCGAMADEHSVEPSVEHAAATSAQPYVAKGSTQSDSLVHHDSEEWNPLKNPVNGDSPNVKTDTVEQILSSKSSDGQLALNSSLSDFPCPDAAAIAPCICTVDGSSIDLDCTEVESEGQLAGVFQQDFSVKQLHGFYMTQNDAIEVLGDILNGVTFEEIILFPGPFALQAIAEYFLLNTRHTLKVFRVYDSNLLSDWFPFATLIAMEALERLTIYKNHLKHLPKISSPSIAVMNFNHGLIDTIDPGTFDDIPNLEELGLQYNNYTELRAGTMPIREGGISFFVDLGNLQDVEPGAFFFFDDNGANSNAQVAFLMSSNKIQALQAGTFPLRNGHTIITLERNQITGLEPGTFVLPELTNSFSLYLSMYDNLMTTFDEAVFGEVMPFITDLELHVNPLICGCDIAWLVLNPAYMSVIDTDATCADGTNLHDLDPQDFEDFC